MEHDPLQPHHHDNNDIPPNNDPAITITYHDGRSSQYSLTRLATFPQSELTYSFTTDHGTHGPYRLRGVALRDLVGCAGFSEIEVISADGFGNRIFARELTENRPILLCTHSNGSQLNRQNGLVRLIVPSETDNALRQIKWVAKIRLV